MENKWSYIYYEPKFEYSIQKLSQLFLFPYNSHYCDIRIILNRLAGRDQLLGINCRLTTREDKSDDSPFNVATINFLTFEIKYWTVLIVGTPLDKYTNICILFNSII